VAVLDGVAVGVGVAVLVGVAVAVGVAVLVGAAVLVGVVTSGRVGRIVGRSVREPVGRAVGIVGRAVGRPPPPHAASAVSKTMANPAPATARRESLVIFIIVLLPGRREGY
jgi:hypothetical protein